MKKRLFTFIFCVLLIINLISATEINRCSELSNDAKAKIYYLQNAGKNIILKEGENIGVGDFFFDLKLDGKEQIIKLEKVFNSSSTIASYDKVEFSYINEISTSGHATTNENRYSATITAEGVGEIIIGGLIYDLSYTKTDTIPGKVILIKDTENEIDSFENCGEPIWCIDSDGGKDYNNKGTIKLLKSNIEMTDVCVIGINQNNPKSMVFEYFCYENGSMGTEEYNCPNGKMCNKGACVACWEDWSCSNFEDCINGTQTRNCWDINYCGSEIDKPTISKDCGNTQQQIVDQSGENNPTQDGEEKHYIKNKEVSIERNINGKNIINIEEKSIETSLEVIEESEKVYVKISGENKEIKILPSEAISKATKIKNIKEIKIEEEDSKAVYTISGTKKAYIFFIISITANVQTKVNVESGDVINVKKPWWHFLALGI